MKKLLVLITALVTLAACSGNISHSPAAAPKTLASSGAAELGDTATTITLQAEPEAAPEVAEITGDRLVRFIASPEVARDLDTALQINALTNDTIMQQCILWVRSPETLRRASELLNVKDTLQVLPIKPTGVISGIAEVRRVKNDIRSGALSARIAAKRSKLADLRNDYKLACGPFLVDGGLAIHVFRNLIPGL